MYWVILNSFAPIAVLCALCVQDFGERERRRVLEKEREKESERETEME